MMIAPILRSSTGQKEGPFHASKWLKHQFLLSEEGMQSLIKAMGSIYICQASGPVDEADVFISTESFLARYRQYVDSIHRGIDIDIGSYKRFFCNYLSLDLDSLYKIEIGNSRVIVKPSRPVLQMQMHTFFPSDLDGKFHSMVMTSESVHFGIQISYPQIFQDAKTQEFFRTNDPTLFPNTTLYKHMIQWLRSFTVPTPFLFHGKKLTATFRTGKDCFTWVNSHSGFAKRELSVVQR